ncbi:hypothetical protein [Nesterenkonia populi]|uniref:hypothetical protein n=1 Tax=Nesterenkonia populi TaxID=1591087 RepID=UPI0011BEDF69|nr:hypothetical protein [Nesterenkonia populi]
MVASAAVQQLDQMVEDYRAAAEQLGAVSALHTVYAAHIVHASGVEWESQAAGAFRTVMGTLEGHGASIQEQAQELREEALLIAGELAALADQARQWHAALTLAASLDFGAIFETFAEEAQGRAARAALETAMGSAEIFADFVSSDTAAPLRHAIQRLPGLTS